MNQKEKLTEATVKMLLLEQADNNYEEFFDNIKNEEINFYQNYVDKLYKYDLENREKSEPKDDSPEESNKWDRYLNGRNDIIDDYDVREYVYMLLQGESIEEQQERLEKDINQHIIKLRKSITKAVGNIINIQDMSKDIYNIEGEKGTCTLQVTPIKLSSSKSIVKTRFKITDIEEKTVEVDKEENSIEENEYIKEWKQKELEGFFIARDYYFNRLKELEDDKNKAEEEYSTAKEKWIEEHNGEKVMGKRVNGLLQLNDKELNKFYQARERARSSIRDFRNENAFYRDYASSIDFEDRCKKIIDKHFEELQTKVQKKIGKIIKITNLGGDDYGFEGEDGKCKVEVIWAGGYNIQRLHSRWIVKNWNE